MNYNKKKMKKRKGKRLMKFQYLLCIYYWTEKSWCCFVTLVAKQYDTVQYTRHTSIYLI